MRRLPSWRIALLALAPTACTAPEAPNVERAIQGLRPSSIVALAAGDIASSNDNDFATSERVRVNIDWYAAQGVPTYVLALGDNTYTDGGGPSTLGVYNSHYELSWGRFYDRTFPAIGNHEYYDTASPNGFHTYFNQEPARPRRFQENNGRPYWSHDEGNWHIVVLDTNCSRSDPGEGNPNALAVDCTAENAWLTSDLANDTHTCELVYGHHPRWSDGVGGAAGHGDNTWLQPIWQTLYTHGVDIYLSGHVHNYHVFPRKDANFIDADNGVRQMVVGTGGYSHDAFDPSLNRTRPGSRNNTDYGIAIFELDATDYTWWFQNTEGMDLDFGSTPCHGPL